MEENRIASNQARASFVKPANVSLPFPQQIAHQQATGFALPRPSIPSKLVEKSRTPLLAGTELQSETRTRSSIKLDLHVVSAHSFSLIVDYEFDCAVFTGHFDVEIEYMIDFSNAVGPCWERLE